MYVFGPVPSRRLGISLGLDIIPYKTCNQDCLYCQLGRTTVKTNERRTYVSVSDLLNELKSVLSKNDSIDYITFAGSGEPTLNSDLGKMIKKIKEISSIPIAVITNSLKMTDEDVRKELSAADLIVPSLDSAVQDTFERLNRPSENIKIRDIIDSLVKFRQNFSTMMWLEVMLIKGINDDKENIENLRSAIEEIKPDEVQLNTAVRPSNSGEAKPLNMEELKDIAGYLGKSCRVIASFDRKSNKVYNLNIEEDVLSLLKRRPCTLKEMSEVLSIHPNELSKYLGTLEKDGKVKERVFNSEKFYQSC
ncbi:MAG: radical SAM protein [Thermoanaerobacteraceae bacterium]|nr:radical SAM protein [Thermoanaerobacteraceae bacterium]